MPRGVGTKELILCHFRVHFLSFTFLYSLVLIIHMRGRMFREKIMKKTIIASLVGLALSPSSNSAEHIALADIVVTASRMEQSKASVLADVSVIEREQIEQAGQSTLVEVLQTQPGIEITNTGGAGKASGIFVRGTSSNHVLV